VQSICNSASLGSASSISSNNISLCKSVNYVQLSNNFSLTQNIHSNNSQLNDDLDNLEQINSDSNYFEKNNDVFENERINHSNFDINEVINNIVNNPAPDNLVDDSSSLFVSWLQEWAIKNRIFHVALNELMTGIKLKYSELTLHLQMLVAY